MLAIEFAQSKLTCFHLSRNLWRDAHLARSKFSAENFSAVARSESGELSRDGHRPSMNIGTNIARPRDISMQDQDKVTKWIEDCGEVKGGKDRAAR